MRPVHGGCWWAVVLAVVAPTVVAAQPAAADTAVEVTGGYGGWFVPGQELPVRVRISADRLIRGTLQVSVGNRENAVPVAIAVEVPGGSEKQFVLTATAGLNQQPDVKASVTQNNRVIASGQTTLKAAGDIELVGVLPGAVRGRAIPGTAPLAVDAGAARFSAIGDAELEQAPASLGPLSTLAADVDDLVRLSPNARAGVLRWVEAGGRLLVDAPKAQPIPGLPDAWQPGTAGRAGAGMGEVVATDGAMAAGRWAGLVEPSSWGVVSGRFAGDTSLSAALASEAGLRSPRLSWLVAFLVVYVILVGPVLFFAVRRRGRPELAWVAVPLVALLFATGSYVAGRDLRKATGLVHATVLSSGASGPQAATYLGVFSPTGETARIGFPAGWTSGSFPSSGQPGPTPTLVVNTPDGPDASLPLDAGQFGSVQARGPTANLGGLEVRATGGPGNGVSGVVRNSTSFALDDVAVFAGSGGTLVGPLGAGQERPFQVANAVQGGFNNGIEFQLWGGIRPDRLDTQEHLSLWQTAMRGAGVNYRAPGTVVAAGFTHDYSPEVRVQGRTARPAGLTIVLARQRVDTGPGGPLELATRRDVVRDPFANPFQSGPRGDRSVVRFVVPEGTDTSALVLHNTFGGGAELWQDGAWQTATCPGGSCAGPPVGLPAPGIACSSQGGPCPTPPPRIVAPGGAAADFTVPPATVRDGVVYVRIPGSASSPAGTGIMLGRAA